MFALGIIFDTLFLVVGPRCGYEGDQRTSPEGMILFDPIFEAVARMTRRRCWDRRHAADIVQGVGGGIRDEPRVQSSFRVKEQNRPQKELHSTF